MTKILVQIHLILQGNPSIWEDKVSTHILDLLSKEKNPSSSFKVRLRAHLTASTWRGRVLFTLFE